MILLTLMGFKWLFELRRKRPHFESCYHPALSSSTIRSSPHLFQKRLSSTFSAAWSQLFAHPFCAARSKSQLGAWLLGAYDCSFLALSHGLLVFWCMCSCHLRLSMQLHNFAELKMNLSLIHPSSRLGGQESDQTTFQVATTLNWDWYYPVPIPRTVHLTHSVLSTFTGTKACCRPGSWLCEYHQLLFNW